jgi:hypothetical protein
MDNSREIEKKGSPKSILLLLYDKAHVEYSIQNVGWPTIDSQALSGVINTNRTQSLDRLLSGWPSEREREKGTQNHSLVGGGGEEEDGRALIAGCKCATLLII